MTWRKGHQTLPHYPRFPGPVCRAPVHTSQHWWCWGVRRPPRWPFLLMLTMTYTTSTPGPLAGTNIQELVVFLETARCSHPVNVHLCFMLPEIRMFHLDNILCIKFLVPSPLAHKCMHRVYRQCGKCDSQGDNLILEWGASVSKVQSMSSKIQPRRQASCGEAQRLWRLCCTGGPGWGVGELGLPLFSKPTWYTLTEPCT